jgi:Cu2+-exporting ATPase
VAHLIAGADMTAFYRQRTDYPPTPDQQSAQTSDWYNDKTWLQTFAKVDAEQQEIPLMVTGMGYRAISSRA